MLDVIVAGAGPAGSIAALTLARAGARVLLIDREPGPHDAPGGDILSPSAVAALRRLDLDEAVLAAAPVIDQLDVAGPHATITTHYTSDTAPRGLARPDRDAWLVDAARRAGAHIEAGVTARAPLLGSDGVVRGVVVTARDGKDLRMPATVVIAADGVASSLAAACGVRPLGPPRRWVIGMRLDGVALGGTAEVHVRAAWRAWLTPLGVERAAFSVLMTDNPGTRSPDEVLRSIVAGDRRLRARLGSTTFDRLAPPASLPHARVTAAGVPGVLLAGAAADSGTTHRDALSRAIEGGRLAAVHALEVLETGDVASAVGRLADARRRAFARGTPSWMARLCGGPIAIDAAGLTARVIGAAPLGRYLAGVQM